MITKENRKKCEGCYDIKKLEPGRNIHHLSSL